MKIISLKAENIKRLKAIQIQPDGSLVVIGGRNAQGKTSVLDAITMALGGASTFCERPLRDGAKNGQVVIDLGDLVVTRSFDEIGGTKLIVKSKDGNIKTSPQTLLDNLCGKISFDPLSFTKMDSKKQLSTLKQLVGLDLDALDAKHKTLFEERTICGRDGQAVKARIEAMPHHPEVPAQEVSVLDLSAKLEAAKEANRKLNEAETTLKAATSMKASVRDNANGIRDKRLETTAIAAAKNLLAKNKDQVANLSDEIKRLKDRLAEIEPANGKLLAEQMDLMKAVDSITIQEAEKADQLAVQAEEECTRIASSIAGASIIPIGPITEQIKNIETTNRKVRENQNYAAQQEAIRQAREKWDELTEKLTAIEKEKKRQISEAKFPVDGLSFDHDRILFNGVPFSQSSGAEQLRVSVAMGLALNPTLRVILIRDGSLLDQDGLKLVAEMAEKHDAQIWLEKVGDGEEVSVIIEDGSVQSVAVGV